MGYTKRQFVEAALEEIGVRHYSFDASPKQLEYALRTLDAMLATWNAQGIRIGYLMPGTPEDSDISSESGVPDSANLAIIKNLAIEIAPSYGIAVSPDTKLSAKKAYDTLLSLNAYVPEMKLPGTMPMGAGHKPNSRGRTFAPETVDPITTGHDGKPILPASI